MRFIILLLLCSTAYAESVTLIPNTSNSNYTPSVSQLVTIGIPFAPCELTDLADFRLLNENNVEVPVFVKETLYWPNTKSCGVKSTRAIKVQFVMNAAAGQKVYSWNLTGRNTASDLAERPVSEIESSIANRAGYNEPAVFGILPPAYLVQTELTPPTTPANTNVFDQYYYPAKFNYAVVNGVSFTSPKAQDWLLDTTSTIYKQAMRRNEIEQYRQAYLNHEFYVDHIVTTLRYGSSSCPGGWGLKPTDYCIDAKLIYTEPQKLHIALTGDDTWLPPATSQIGNTLHDVINAQADLLFTGSKRTVYTNSGSVYSAGFRTPYDERSDLYTERHAGIGLISILNACEITHAAAACAAVNTAIDNIYNHNLDTNNVWDTPYAGYQKHSWMKHENVQQPWVGIIDRVVDSNTFVLRSTLGTPNEIAVGSKIEAPVSVTLTGPITANGANWRAPVSGGIGADVAYATLVYIDGKFVGRARALSPPQAGAFEIYGKPAAVNLQSYSAGETLNISLVAFKTTSAVVDNGNSTWTIDTNLPATALRVGGNAVISRNSIFPDSDEAFSPWMSDILMDGLWQFYHWSDDAARKQKAAKVILGLARATIAFSIDAKTTQPATIAAIESAFSDWPTAAGIDIKVGINDYEYADAAPLSRYAASYWMTTPAATSEYINNISEGGYQKQHLPELMHAMALGMFFETDPAKKAAMALVAKQTEVWFDEYRNTVARGAIRSFPWQLRSDPYGTWQFVRSLDGGSVVTPLPPPPAALPPALPPLATSPPALPPLAGNTQTQAGSSSVNNLNVASGNNVVNQGRIYNLTNAGTVSGGILGGIVTNTGTLQNVTLDQGTTLRGGLIKGVLLGNGTVTDAVLDITGIGDGIVLGAGVRVTSATARSLTGLDLSAAVRDLAGKMDMDTMILIDDEESGITLRDITADAVNAYFQNSLTDASTTADGLLSIINPGLAGVQVSLVPAAVSTTAIGRGVRMSDNGELEMIDEGVLVNFLPVAQDRDAVDVGLANIGAALSEFDSGVMRVNFAGISFSFRFSPMVQPASGASFASKAGAVVFKGNGQGRNPADHRIIAWYPNGRSQELLPYLHDMDALASWMGSAGLNYRIGAASGVIRIFDGAGTLVWKGIPDYKLASADVGTVGVEFSDIGDINGDGLADRYFSTEQKAQVVYGLPL